MMNENPNTQVTKDEDPLDQLTDQAKLWVRVPAELSPLVVWFSKPQYLFRALARNGFEDLLTSFKKGDIEHNKVIKQQIIDRGNELISKELETISLHKAKKKLLEKQAAIDIITSRHEKIE